MSRAPLLVAGLLLSLSAASCGDDVTIGSSKFDSTNADGGSSGPDGSDGSSAGPDPTDDDLARIAEEMAGSWSGSFLDLDLTLHLTYTADRGGTVRLECVRGGQECGDGDGGAGGFDFFKAGGKYWVVESTGVKTTGLIMFNPLNAGAVVFTLDSVKNTLTMGPPVLLVTTFTKIEGSDASRAR